MLHMLTGILHVRVNGTYNDMEGLIGYVTHVNWGIICKGQWDIERYGRVNSVCYTC